MAKQLLGSSQREVWYESPTGAQCATSPKALQVWVLRSRLLLLLLEEGEQGNTRDLHDLETDTGNISHSVALTTEPRNQHLILHAEEGSAAISSKQQGGTTSVTHEESYELER